MGDDRIRKAPLGGKDDIVTDEKKQDFSEGILLENSVGHLQPETHSNGSSSDARLPGDKGGLPESRTSGMNFAPNPPVLTVRTDYQEGETRQGFGKSQLAPQLSRALAYEYDCGNSGVTPCLQKQWYPINFRVNKMEESLPNMTPTLSQGVWVPTTLGTEITNQPRRQDVQGAFTSITMEANTDRPNYYSDAQPSTSGLPIPVDTDMDVSDDSEDLEEHLRINLHPPLVKSPTKWEITTKGSLKYKKKGRDKSTNYHPVNVLEKLHSPDIDPQQVPGFVLINIHSLQLGASDTTLERTLNGVLAISTSFSTSVIMSMFVLFNGFLSSLYIQHYVDILSSSTAFNDSIDLEVKIREDMSTRFAVCQICGIPRYLRRVGKRQVWRPTIDGCRHTEPYFYGADFQHMWWTIVQRSGLTPINPSFFPFCVLLTRLGDLADLTLAVLIVSRVFPILNRSNILSEMPLRRQAFFETDEQLTRTAAYGFVKWIQGVARRSKKFLSHTYRHRCFLCGGRYYEDSHYSSKQPLECKAIVDLTRDNFLAAQFRHLVRQRRPIIWMGWPSVQALLHALRRASLVQIQAVSILFCLIGAVILTHDDHSPQLFSAGPFIYSFK